MATQATPLKKVSGFFGAFRWVFMPLGLFALVAVGVHAAADLLDDHVLRVVESLDAWLDGLLAQSESLASWVNRVDSRERTLIARAVALAWELAVAGFVALPLLGYDEKSDEERRFTFRRETWRTLLSRLNQKPTPMRLVRPFVTAVFAVGGAYAVSRLVESTLFVGLVGDVAPADVAQTLARVLGGLAMALVLFTHGWRAVLRALEHADARCEEAAKASKVKPWLVGVWGSGLAIPLAVALLLEARSLLSFVM
ncbi:MAG: hypothetical protein AB1938_31055 [Myxococcota bacterium]